MEKCEKETDEKRGETDKYYEEIEKLFSHRMHSLRFQLVSQWCKHERLILDSQHFN